MTSSAYRANFSQIEWSLPEWQPRKAAKIDRRSRLSCPHVISDHMPLTQSMADGRYYDSKSAISAATRRAGLRELGNDKLSPRQRPKIDRREVKASIERAKARFERGERAS